MRQSAVIYFFSFLFFFSWFPVPSFCNTNTIPATENDTGYIVIGSIRIDGNDRTKEYIIRRELTFAERDTIPFSLIQYATDRSEKNILNTSLFLSAVIEFIDSADHHVNCLITVAERWYVFPRLFFSLVDRNFNVWWVEEDHKLSRTQYGPV